RILGSLLEKKFSDTFLFNRVVHYGSIITGCYAAYAMGSNNVANAMGPYVAVGFLSPFLGAVIGGACISLGVLTYSKKVIFMVGKQITALDPFSALIAILSTALTVHFFTQFGIPVSTSQSVVGSVIGLGLTKGMVAVNVKMFWMIPAGWVISVTVSGGMAFLMNLIKNYQIFSFSFRPINFNF
ncbi:MAG: inorganic phosphate transporter, partial [Thermodesulfobacteriota bacterium]|nr:inorganic phosphate transporter [Thermodesulfobacteriota bacterium]